ncbi:unnamed protein product [Hymenolepis diminuta]|uniref:cyclin-dependent kinase n=1 Tax=Hymenolepis diminuta TaxID=6216 RepID=A0A158QF66_HYMDI|nr:unnamed protein product [Hymenolepis diminuta]
MALDIINEYFRLEKIGEGTYGVVYKCRCRKSNTLKAMKRIKLENFDDGIPATALREIALLKEVAHPNIVKYDVYFHISFSLERIVMDRGRLFLIFEFLTFDLRKYIEKQPNRLISNKLVQSFMYQMLQGLLYCHARRIIHRDLKPQNVLIDVESNVVKLADFGLAKSLGYPPRKMTHEIVTLWYRAPEIMFGEDYYCAGVDMWAMGCIFAELAAGDPIFRGDSEIDQLFKIFKILGVPTEETWPGITRLRDYNPIIYPEWHSFKIYDMPEFQGRLHDDGFDLLSKMLLYDPVKRISAQEALLHPYFADFDLESVPAVGEEFVGLPPSRIPEKFLELFQSATTITDDVSEVIPEEEAEAKKLNILPSTVMLGASTYHVAAARDKVMQEQAGGDNEETEEEEDEEIFTDVRESKKRALHPLSENQQLNMSLD